MSIVFSHSVVAEPTSVYNFSTSQDANQRWIEVLVDCPGGQGVMVDSMARTTEITNNTTPFRSTYSSYQLYTYRVPSHLTVQAGNIVLVPFGSQQRSGIVIRFVASLPEDVPQQRLKDIEAVISDLSLPDRYWQLLNRVSQYYCTAFIEVLRTAFPPTILQKSHLRIRLKPDQIPSGYQSFCSPKAQEIVELLRSQKDHSYTLGYIKKTVKVGSDRALTELLKRGWIEKYSALTHQIQSKTQKAVTLVGDPNAKTLTKTQREILQLLQRQGGEMWVSEFQKIRGTTTKTWRNLEQAGYVTLQDREILRIERGIEQERDTPKALTPAQQQAVAKIRQVTDFAQILLHGVTGSGKTEVYLQAIAPLLEQGQSALVLVPEIGLTPQLTDRFRARLGNKVCVYHSGLSTGERYDTWREMLTGTPQVVIGTRSAVFAPLPNLGLIILDEEHDSSFKQTQILPTYHARTVATWRAELENCPIILGSATPSLESWVEIQENSTLSPNYYLSLPERIYSRPLPPVEIVDMRAELKEGNRSIFSRSLQEALENLSQQQKQGILFINRRGHSTFVSCRSCGYVMECPHCDVSLSYHYTHEGATELLRCHYCNYSTLQPRHCPECASPYLKFFGSGTQKVTQELSRQFPQLRALRFDSDTTRTKGAHRQLLAQFTQGEADILVGTQMLTKGLDVQQVTLVGVISADGLLYHSDYRAVERAFQTLTQVAGRAGRGEDTSKVIIQTYSPENPVIQAVKHHDYHQFIATELPQRKALTYPPYGRLILLRLSGENAEEVQFTAEKIAETCREQLSSLGEVLGPAPASIMRVARRYRWQILLKLPLDTILPDPSELIVECPPTVKITLDVDPLSID